MGEITGSTRRAGRLARWRHAATWVLAAALGPVTGLAIAEAATERARTSPEATVVEVVDGDTVILDRAIDGSREVRLTGLQAPKLPLGRPGFPTWPLAADSRAALQALTLGQRVTLVYGGRRMDRHGRLLAHLRRDDGLWVQGEMLSLGMARVYTFADNRWRAAQMLERERAARAARRGIWAHPFYAVRAPERVAADIGSFQVIEGRVVDAVRVRSVIYLNFGADWRTDFTVRIEAPARRAFAGAGIDPLTLKGRLVRVRGWLTKRNGPMIEATHPEQIERLAGPGL